MIFFIIHTLYFFSLLFMQVFLRRSLTPLLLLLLAPRLRGEEIVEAEVKLSNAQDEAEVKLSNAQDEAEVKLSNTQDEAEAKLTNAQDETKVKLSNAQDEAEAKLSNTQDEEEANLSNAQDEAEAKLSNAQDKAEANSQGNSTILMDTNDSSRPVQGNRTIGFIIAKVIPSTQTIIGNASKSQPLWNDAAPPEIVMKHRTERTRSSKTKSDLDRGKISSSHCLFLFATIIL